eukprot:scaffold53427_cov25-Tisochrysis_lutea.AAC.3
MAPEPSTSSSSKRAMTWPALAASACCSRAVTEAAAARSTASRSRAACRFCASTTERISATGSLPAVCVRSRLTFTCESSSGGTRNPSRSVSSAACSESTSRSTG